MSKRFDKIKRTCTTLCMQCNEDTSPKLNKEQTIRTGPPPIGTWIIVLLWVVLAYAALDGALYNIFKRLFNDDGSTFGVAEIVTICIAMGYSLVTFITLMYDLYKRGHFVGISHAINNKKNKRKESKK